MQAVGTGDLRELLWAYKSLSAEGTIQHKCRRRGVPNSSFRRGDTEFFRRDDDGDGETPAGED